MYFFFFLPKSTVVKDFCKGFVCGCVVFYLVVLGGAGRVYFDL